MSDSIEDKRALRRMSECALWGMSECACKSKSSNPACTLYQIIRYFKKKDTLDNFLAFADGCPDIFRVAANKQRRPYFIGFTSKCRSGRFYIPLPPTIPESVRADPSKYTDMMKFVDHESNDDGSMTEEISSDDELPNMR